MKTRLLKLWLRFTRIDDEDIQSEWGTDLLILFIFVSNAITHGYFIPGLISEMEHEPKAIYPLIYCGLQTTLCAVLSLEALWRAGLKFRHRKPWQPRLLPATELGR